jgi:hypothetical protein
VTPVLLRMIVYDGQAIESWNLIHAPEFLLCQAVFYLAGLLSTPLEICQVTPKFCKQYAQVGVAINQGLKLFREEVESVAYPSKATSPYKIADAELQAFLSMLNQEGLHGSASAAAQAADFAGLKQ